MIVQRLAEVAARATPDFSHDARAALLNMVLTGELKESIGKATGAEGLSLEDVQRELRYADKSETRRRTYSALSGNGLHLALLQIPEWIANDGAHVGALDETRYLFRKKAVRMLSSGVDAPAKGMDTLLTNWHQEDDIDARFVPWRYAGEFLEGRYTLGELFSFDVSATKSGSKTPRLTEELLNAILSAFVDYSEVKRFVYFQLNVRLDAIVGEKPLEEVLFELWQWAESHGVLQKVIDGLKKVKKDNAVLVAQLDSAVE